MGVVLFVSSYFPLVNVYECYSMLSMVLFCLKTYLGAVAVVDIVGAVAAMDVFLGAVTAW